MFESSKNYFIFWLIVHDLQNKLTYDHSTSCLALRILKKYVIEVYIILRLKKNVLWPMEVLTRKSLNSFHETSKKTL